MTMRNWIVCALAAVVGAMGSVAFAAAGEPDLDTVITTVPVAVIILPDGSVEIPTKDIPPTRLLEYCITNGFDKVNQYMQRPDGTLVHGIEFHNPGPDTIIDPSVRLPHSVYPVQDGEWAVGGWRIVSTPMGSGFAPGRTFIFSYSKQCKISIEDPDSALGCIPISAFIGVPEGPMIDIQYLAAGAPNGANIQPAIDAAKDAWQNLLANEQGVFRFLIKWDDPNNPFLQNEDAIAGANPEYAVFSWNPVQLYLTNTESDTNAHPGETALYAELPNNGEVPYRWSGDNDDFADVVAMTSHNADVTVHGLIGDRLEIILNPNPMQDGGPMIIDYDPTDGTAPGGYGLTASLIHEMGHNFGFMSFVERIESGNQTDTLTIWDVFRLGDSATSNLHISPSEFRTHKRELELGTPAWGVAGLQLNGHWAMANGLQTSGQASHWWPHNRTSPNYIGLMMSVQATGNAQVGGTYLQVPDIRAFDVLGYDIDDHGIDPPPQEGTNDDPPQDGTGDPAQPTGLIWTLGNNGTAQHVFVYNLEIGPERVEVFAARDLPASTTTVTIPADTLLPGNQHEWFVTTANWRGFAYSPTTQFATSGGTCLADVNNDGVLNGADFTAWINAFNNNLPECDQNSDGNCDPADFTAWVANFNAGCP